MSVELIKYGDPIKGIRNGVDRGVLELAIQMTSIVRSLAPVLSGDFRNSVTWKTHNKSGPSLLSVVVSRGVAYVGSALFYAIWLEFGTRFMAPQPSFRPAAEILRNSNVMATLAKIQREELRGPLKEGQKRERFN